MSKKPVTPPSPRRTRPLVHIKDTSARPLTAALMARCKAIRDDSDGKIDNAAIAESVGTTKQEVAEHLSGSRSAPNAEKTIGYITFFFRYDRNLVKDLITANEKARSILKERKTRIDGEIQEMITTIIKKAAKRS